MTAVEIRVLAYAGGLLAVLAVGWQVNRWRVRSDRLEAATTELAGVRASIDTARRVRTEVVGEYETELSTLRAGRAAGPVPVVRVCRAAPMLEHRTAAGGTDGAAAAAGNISAGPGADSSADRDVGPALYAAADRADELSAQLRALQLWAAKVTTPPAH